MDDELSPDFRVVDVGSGLYAALMARLLASAFTRTAIILAHQAV